MPRMAPPHKNYLAQNVSLKLSIYLFFALPLTRKREAGEGDARTGYFCWNSLNKCFLKLLKITLDLYLLSYIDVRCEYFPNWVR